MNVKTMTEREITLTMNMWGMAKSTIKKVLKKLKQGRSHTFKNGMTVKLV